MGVHKAALGGAQIGPGGAEGRCGFAQARGTWAVGAKADVLCAVRADADVLLQWVDADYLGQLTQLMPFLPAEVRPAGITASLGENL